MLKTPSSLAAVFTAVLLVACGGTDDTVTPAPRGAIVSAQLAGQVTRAQVDAGTAASGLQPLSGLAQCDVDIRYVLYITRGPKGEEVTASTGVLVPGGTGANCTGQRPVVLYAHGTATDKSRNMADVRNQAEASLQMAMYAAQGFIVVAPNYLGYDRSTLPYHPYLNAEAQAVDMIDGLRAAKTHLAEQSAVKASAKLLLAGYSQGGHVSMATQRAIERDNAGEFKVSANGAMSGPYNLVGQSDVVTGPGPINAGATLFVPLLFTSYQKAYGDLYTTPSDVYQAPYAEWAEGLLPSDVSVNDLLAQGKLPADPTFTKLYGTGGLLTDASRAGYATSNYRKALQTNTLLGWTPKSAVALCGGAADPTVFFQVNTSAAQADFASRGLSVPAFDLENRATLPAGPTGDAIYGAFQARKAAAGANVQSQYHGTLVPPFCAALVRGFFQQVLAAGG
jgi:pimeloyl-ACP methyl ester carboxylesterase